MHSLLRSTLLCALVPAFTAGLHAQGNNTRALPAQNRTFPQTPPEEPPTSSVSDWWNGDYALGNWGGLRDKLKDDGAEFFGFYNAIIAGNPVGGKNATFS